MAIENVEVHRDRAGPTSPSISKVELTHKKRSYASRMVDTVDRWGQEIRQTEVDERQRQRAERPLNDAEREKLYNRVKRRLPIARKALRRNTAIKKGANAIKAAAAFSQIIIWTWYLALIQAVFGLFCMVTSTGLMAYEQSWAEYWDVFGIGSGTALGIYFLSFAVIMVMWFFTILVAFFIYLGGAVRMFRGWSIFILVLSMAFCALPFINIVPWAWVWCSYVVKSQVD